MAAAEKARKTVLGIEIPRDELAWRIAEQCLGVRPNKPMTATEKLDALAIQNPGMVADFRRAADASVKFFHECVNAGRALR